MAFWSYAADALWILALSIMFGLSRAAWGKIPPGAKPPVLGMRLSRGLAVWGLPGIAFLFSLWLLYEARTRPQAIEMAVIIFGVRAITASLFAMLHLRLIAGALDALDREGALKP